MCAATLHSVLGQHLINTCVFRFLKAAFGTGSMIIFLRDIFVYRVALFPISSVLQSFAQLEQAVFSSRWKQLVAAGKGCRVIVSPIVWQTNFATGRLMKQTFSSPCLKTDGILKCLCLHLKGFVRSPVLCGGDVVSSLVNVVEMSANLVSPSPSAEGTTPSSASSSSLSSLPGSSGKTHAI